MVESSKSLATFLRIEKYIKKYIYGYIHIKNVLQHYSCIFFPCIASSPALESEQRNKLIKIKYSLCLKSLPSKKPRGDLLVEKIC